jgi:hypothetical protein
VGAPGEDPDRGKSDEPSLPETAREETEAFSVRERIRLMGWARILLFLLALAAFILGGLNAWRSESSTALLIVGAILAIFAVLFGPDWREIQLRYGEAQARVFRGVEGVLEQAEQSSPSDVMRKQIADIRKQVEELAEKEMARDRRRRAARSSLAPLIPPPQLPLRKPQPSHMFSGSSSVMLTLQVPAFQEKAPYTCAVVTPGGERLAQTVTPPVSISAGVTITPMKYSVSFPDEFRGSGPLEPGLYQVEWRQGDGSARQGTSELAAALAFAATTPVARDSFTIPERKPGQEASTT